MNGNQTTFYVMCNPLTLEGFTFIGPRAATNVEYFSWNEIEQDIIYPNFVFIAANN